MDKYIENLQDKVDNIQKELLEIKQLMFQGSVSEKIKDLEKNAEFTRNIIKHELKKLEGSRDESLSEKKKMLEEMLANLEVNMNELYTLKTSIVFTPSSIDNQSTGGGEGLQKKDSSLGKKTVMEQVSMPAGAIAGGYVGGRMGAEILKKLYPTEKISETLVIQKTKKNMELIIKMLELRKRDTQLLPFQKANIEKAIHYFEEAKNSSSAIQELGIRKKLGSAFPIETMQKLDIDPKVAKQLRNLSQDADYISKIVQAKTEEEILDILRNKGISNLSPDAVKLLQLANTADEVKDITKVLSAVRPIKTLAKGLKAIPFLDLVAAGVDVFVYFGESSEANIIEKTNALRGKYKQQQANLHLGLAGVEFATAITTAALLAASSGPPGWVVGVIGGVVIGITTATREIADTYYYDIMDFYLKNKQDYLSQYRMEIKLAILQATVRGESSFSLSGAEQFADIFDRSKNIEKHKTITLEDAYWALIYQEEKINYPYVARYNPEYPQPLKMSLSGEELKKYEEEKQQLDEVIRLRMEYIKKFLPHTTTAQDKEVYQQYLRSIRGSQGIKAIEKIIAESKVYQQMKQDTIVSGYTNIGEYYQAKGEKLQQKNIHWFMQLENLYIQQPEKMEELYINILNFDAVASNDPTYQEKYQQLLPKIEFIKQYYEWKKAFVSGEQKIGIGNIQDMSYVEIEKMLDRMENQNEIMLHPAVFSEEEVKLRLKNGNEIQRFEESYTEYTSSVGQNILYRIAKEIYGYTGSNTLMDLIMYYTPEKKDSLGIYFDEGRHININRGSDRKFTLQDLEQLSSSQIITLFTLDMSFLWGPRIITAENIDTPTENSDEWINKEFHERIKKIIQEEKTYQTLEKKREIQKNIIEYIKQYGSDGYIKLPYYLVNDAKRAGIGNAEYFFYRYHANTNSIDMCTSKAYIHEYIDLSEGSKQGFEQGYHINVYYIENVREQFSEEEKKYIDSVEYAYQRLMQLITREGRGNKEDELDLPEEIERIIADKYLQWQKHKQSLLGYEPVIAIMQLKKYYKEYKEYFENIYMGILLELRSYTFTNDIDAHGYVMNMISKSQTELFSKESNNITLNKELFSEEQSKVFDTIITQKKLFGKTIKTLLLSPDPEEQDKGNRGAKQVIKAMLEADVLMIDDFGAIQGIKSGTITQKSEFLIPSIGIMMGTVNTLYDTYKKESIINTLINYHLKDEYYVGEYDDIVFSEENISKKTDEEIMIKQLTSQEQEVYKNIPLLVKKIESTLNNIVWKGKRGNIIFDPEQSTITSWGASTKIDIQNLRVDNLPITCKDIVELLYIVNSINWLKGEYLKQYPEKKGKFYFEQGESDLYVRDATRKSLWINDTNIIKKETLKKHMPSLLQEENKKKYLSYINNL